jgi:hypothetical protein
VLSKMNNVLHQIKTFCKKNDATILTCIGGVGVVTTTVMAVKATPKALEKIKVAKEEKGEDLTKFETVIVAAPTYVPTALIGLGTLTCIFGANVLNKRHQAALVSAYTLLDSSFKEYKQKVKEVYGEEGEKNVRNEISKDKYDEETVENKNENDGKTLFYDEYSQRYFYSTVETVLRAKYEINKILSEDYGAYLNEWYDLVGLDTVDYGDYMGWSTSQMYEMYWSAWIDFYHEKMTMNDGTEYYTIVYTEPMPDFLDY